MDPHGSTFIYLHFELIQDNVEDPLKEERLRRQKELAEDEAALAAMGSSDEQDAAKRRKMAEFKLWKSQRKQSDPNKVAFFEVTSKYFEILLKHDTKKSHYLVFVNIQEPKYL